MRMVTSVQRFARFATTMAAVCVVSWPMAGVASDKKTYTEIKEQVKLPHRSLELTCARPASPRTPAFLVIFASGDGGLRGDSAAVYRHMAERGRYVAAYSSREALAQHKHGDFMTLRDAAEDIGAMMREAKRLLDLPETTPTVVSGVSRGASMVVLAGGTATLRAGIAGGIAIALTRESDYITAPPVAERTPFMKLDDKSRLLTYPLLDQFGSTPVAVIQSTNDKYIGAKDSRALMGPDTATRRLYEVPAKNHSFSGGEDEMLKDVDLALDWIASTIHAVAGAK
jgi:hypothetical protein